MHSQGTALKQDTWRLHSGQELQTLRDEIIADRDPDQPLITICHGTGCLANGSFKVYEAFKKTLDEAGVKARVMPGIKTTGCHGFCSRGPLVIIRPQGLFDGVPLRIVRRGRGPAFRIPLADQGVGGMVLFFKFLL